MTNTRPSITPSILRFVQHADGMSSKEDILSQFSEHLTKFGIEFVFYKIKHSHEQVAQTWSNVKISGDGRADYHNDPFFKYCCSTYAPTYTGSEFLSDYPFLKPNESRFVQAAADIEFRTGLAVPVSVDVRKRIGGFNLGTRFGKQEFLEKTSEYRYKIAFACFLLDRVIQKISDNEIGADDLLHNQNSGFTNTQLTSRERDVLFLLSQGYSRKEMARLTNLSHYTIADYVKNLYSKLKVSNRSEATRLAMTMGLRPPHL